MNRLAYREGRAKVTDEIKRTVSQLIDQEKDWGTKKKHPSRWYRSETAKILGLDENNNPSLRSYEELCRIIRKNARVQNPVDKPWNTALLDNDTLDSEIVSWIIHAQYNLKKYLSRPLTIREIKWFSRLFGFRKFIKPLPEMEGNPDLQFLFLSNVLTTWSQIYAEREKIDNLAGIEEPDHSELDLAIVDNDYLAIREYSDELLIDQIHNILGKRKELSETNWNKIQEVWTLPSLKNTILVFESNVLRHSLGIPDMSSQYLRAYHNLLIKYDHGPYEEEYGATYQDRIDRFIQIRKKVLEIQEDEIDLVNSVFPEYELWWEKKLKKKRSKPNNNKEDE